MSDTVQPAPGLRGLTREHWIKVSLLFSWFFLAISAFWLLKPVRVASLLTHLGASQTPYLKIGSMVVVGAVVAIYTRVVERVSRRNLALGVGTFFSLLFVLCWLAMRLGGEALRSSTWFVYAFYILADVYSTVMVAVFWTYTNDVVSRREADVLYGPIGLGGILGGVVGGLGADVLARPVGPTNLLLICAALALGGAFMAVVCERLLKPPPRKHVEQSESALGAAIAGAREVRKSRYLLLLVGILVAYEVASTMNDFALNVLFERAYRGGTQITQMYGRLGWVINVTALVAQLVLVPLVLPRKRLALLLVPVAMLVVAAGIIAVPVVAMVFVLAATDNGLSYSVQQSTKETLYVPLSDTQKYKAKAFIDMFVQRAAKALAAFAIIGITAAMGVSVRAPLFVSVIALAVWVALAAGLARMYYQHVRGEKPTGGEPKAPPSRSRPSLAPGEAGVRPSFA